LIVEKGMFGPLLCDNEKQLTNTLAALAHANTWMDFAAQTLLQHRNM
jgi:sugar diacid utilization regulator